MFKFKRKCGFCGEKFIPTTKSKICPSCNSSAVNLATKQGNWKSFEKVGETK